LGHRVEKFPIAIAGWLPWVCLSILGCAGLPASDGSSEPAIARVSHDDVEDGEESEETGSIDTGPTATGSAATGMTTFAHSARRTFPDQGWWCSDYTEWLSPARADKGYTIILTGVEGTSFHNIGIARGLIEAGHPAAVEVRDWTTGHWPLFVYHLMALERNKQQAREIAEQILKYQTQYPGRPVTLIGHSGGAAMAVLTLEALPADRNVNQVVLLAAAISSDYDLTTALAHSEKGIVNFHSWGDVPHLVVGTLALGTIDRQHTVSAGARGFRVPADLDDDGRELYATRLQQVPYRLAMLKSLNAGGHTGPTNHKFVADWVAPRLALK
jgi:pimeloyl-ACP methyl ester carboxylesterase